MNQDPPVLQPIDDKEYFNCIDSHSPGKVQTPEHRMNGFMTNGSGSTSPPMPILYQADREPLNIQDIFSAFANDAFEVNNVDYSKTPRKESDSLFEKIYKDYSTTLTHSSNIIDSTKDSKMSSQEMITESELNYKTKPNIDLGITKLQETINDSHNHLTEISESKEPDSNLMTNEDVKAKPDIIKRFRKRKFKKSPTLDNSIIDDEDLKKLGIKTFPNKRKRTKSIGTIKAKIGPETTSSTLKDQSDNKYLKSPYITLRTRSPCKKQSNQAVSVISTEYEIINPSIRSHAGGGIDYQSSSIYRPNLKMLSSYQYLAAHPCICAFCGKTSEFLKLGSLYGPYFIDTESIPGLPLTSIFPSDSQQDSVVGASGKSAIKTDKNGGLKMVIQSTRSGTNRNSSNKKSSLEDYRITWEGEVWFHRECILWAPCTYLRGDGKIGGLEEALKMALNAECCVCHKIGAILNCTAKSCEKNFHYYCALSLGSKLNQEQFSMLCIKHKERW